MLAASSFLAAADAKANFQEIDRPEAKQPPAAVASTLESPLAALVLPTPPAQEGTSADGSAPRGQESKDAMAFSVEVNPEGAPSPMVEPTKISEQSEAAKASAQKAQAVEAAPVAPTLLEQIVVLGASMWLISKLAPWSKKEAKRNEQSSVAEPTVEQKKPAKKEASQKQAEKKQDNSCAPAETNTSPKPWSRRVEEYQRKYYAA